MRRVITAGLAAIAGCFLIAPTPASAVPVAIDRIIFQQDGSVNASVFSATTDFSLADNVLTVVLRNTSSGVSGGAAATNLLAGIAFNFPTGIAISNDGVANSVAITALSTGINFAPPILDTTWGAANGPINSINNITGALGSVNAGITTLQSQMDFDLAGGTANLSGPGFGILSSSVPGRTAGGQNAVQDSLTFRLLLSGLPAHTSESAFIEQINNGFVVASFGSPSPVPEPSTLLLLGTVLVTGLGYSARHRLLRTAPGPEASGA